VLFAHSLQFFPNFEGVPAASVPRFQRWHGICGSAKPESRHAVECDSKSIHPIASAVRIDN